MQCGGRRLSRLSRCGRILDLIYYAPMKKRLARIPSLKAVMWLFLCAVPAVSQAYDVAGMVRIDAGTNCVAAFEMPFEPLGDASPECFISGNFTGDGVTTSVCHRTYIYQDGKLIYTNKGK